jgi:hypothetical protein
LASGFNPVSDVTPVRFVFRSHEWHSNAYSHPITQRLSPRMRLRKIVAAP